MGGVVVGELGERQELGPVILIVTDVQTEVGFDDLIDSFRLSIRFGMIGRGEVLLDAQDLVEILPERRDELVPAVGYDVVRDAVF